MRARQVVLLTPSESSAPTQLLFHQHFVRVSPLAATLMDLPASVANKRLTAELSPFDATLTKNRGVGGVIVNQLPPRLAVPTSGRDDVQTWRRSDLPTFRRSLLSLFAPRMFHKSFAIKGSHTLSQNCRVYTNSSQNGTCRPAHRGQDYPGHCCVLRLSNSSTFQWFSPSRRSDVPTFRRSDVATFRPSDVPSPLPFPPRCILFVPLPWPTTTAEQTNPRRHRAASWRALCSAPTTK